MTVSGRAAPHTSPMATIGVPTEIKPDEQRVALTPDGVRELVSQGMEVRVQAGAAPVVNGVPEQRMRLGCGSATIGIFAQALGAGRARD